MTTKTKKALFPLTADPKKNVLGKANQRLVTALKAIKTLGDCCTKDYDWSEDQIAAVDKQLLAAMDQTITNLREGVTAKTKAGIPQLI